MREAQALVDTGATSTAIAPWLADELGLEPMGRRVIGTAAGQRRATAYRFSLGFQASALLAPSGLTAGPVFLPNEVYGIDFTEGIDFQILIGMDILAKGSFEMHPDHRWRFAF